MQNSKHIHLIGICGTAMASLAGMLQLQGHRVTGSDAAAYPPMSDLLAALGIPVLRALCGERILTPRPDLVVVGNAISRGNVELEYVLDDADSVLRRWLRCCTTSFCRGASRWWWPGRMARRRRQACWRGSTRLLRGGMPALAPSFLIGGVAENFGTSFMVRPTRPFHSGRR